MRAYATRAPYGRRGTYRRREKVVAPSVPFVACGECSGGWCLDAAGAAYRCWCWNKWMTDAEPERMIEP